MDNFRDSYFQVDWDLTSKRLKGTYWGKQYDTGRGFAVTVINGGQVVAPTTEVLRLKWEKPDNTAGYVNATIVNGKFIVENIDQMFTVHGSARADFELSVGGEFVASITFYVNVEKAVAVDAVASSSEFTALQTAINTVEGLDTQLADITQQLEDGTAGIDDGVISSSKVWSSAKVQGEIQSILNLPTVPYVSETPPSNPTEGMMWFKKIPRIPVDTFPITDYFFRFDAFTLGLNDNDKVSEWADLSGNGYKVTQSVLQSQPTFLTQGLNDNPAISFNGTNFMDNEGFALDNKLGATVFIVGKFNNTSSSSTIFGIGLKDAPGATFERAFNIKFSGSSKILKTQINAEENLGGVIVDTNSFIYASAWNGAKNKVYKNGDFIEEANFSTAINVHDRLRLGGMVKSFLEPYNGLISEIIYFSRGLTDGEVESVNTYLMEKWGFI